MGDVQLRAANTVLTSPSALSLVMGEAPPADGPPSGHSNHEPSSYESSLFTLDSLLENYYLTVLLPLAIFIFITGLLLSALILKVHRSRRQARLGHYSVIGSQVYRRY